MAFVGPSPWFFWHGGFGVVRPHWAIALYYFRRFGPPIVIDRVLSVGLGSVTVTVVSRAKTAEPMEMHHDDARCRLGSGLG